MKPGTTDNHLKLDEEWVELMLEARSRGLSTEDVSKVLRILQEQGNPAMNESVV